MKCNWRFLFTKYHLLLENIFSLMTIKGLEYILQFITFPYLVRVLGVTTFGSIVFAQSLIQYFTLFTDYGFNLTGPKDIAKHDNVKERGTYFTNIFWAKMFLLGISTLCFVIICWIFFQYSSYDVSLLIVLYVTVIGNVIFPIWFFQGIQQMQYITIVNVIARFGSVVGIFLLVQSPDDYLWAGFLQSVPPFIAGMISWYILKKNYPEIWCWPSWKGIYKTLQDARDIFVSTVAINIYTVSNTVILGFMTNVTVVGYFSAAYKIVNCVQQGMAPITQAVYPHISKIMSQDKKRALQFIRRLFYLFSGGNLVISVILFFFAKVIVHILLGNGYEESVIMLRILAVLPFVISVSNILGIQTMLPFGLHREFSKIITMSAIVNIVLGFPMIYFFSGNGTCISMVVTECFVTIAMGVELKKKQILL